MLYEPLPIEIQTWYYLVILSATLVSVYLIKNLFAKGDRK